LKNEAINKKIMRCTTKKRTTKLANSRITKKRTTKLANSVKYEYAQKALPTEYRKISVLKDLLKGCRQVEYGKKGEIISFKKAILPYRVEIIKTKAK
jgi:hypothetical protein